MKKLHFKNLSEAKSLLKSSLRKKAGVYQLINRINKKSYIGSSVDLERRISEYLNPLYINRNLEKGQSLILNAILKYGYINFKLKILEIIDFGSEQTISEKKCTILEKEQNFLDTIKPEYNLNKKAGSNLGRIYSNIVRAKMSLAKIGKPGNKKGAIMSEETRAFFRERSGMAKSIIMLDENNQVLATFKSIQIAQEMTGISRKRITRCVKGIGKYTIEKGIKFKFEFSKKD